MAWIFVQIIAWLIQHVNLYTNMYDEKKYFLMFKDQIPLIQSYSILTRFACMLFNTYSFLK